MNGFTFGVTAPEPNHELPWFLRARDTQSEGYQSFFGSLNQALEQFIEDSSNDGVLALFMEAYNFRQSLPWMRESVDNPNWIGGGGLGYAVRYALMSYYPSADEPWEEGSIVRLTDSLHFEPQDRRNLQPAAVLLFDLDEMVVKSLANGLHRSGRRPEILGAIDLVAHVHSAFEYYGRRPSSGISTDPW